MCIRRIDTVLVRDVTMRAERIKNQESAGVRMVSIRASNPSNPRYSPNPNPTRAPLPLPLARIGRGGEVRSRVVVQYKLVRIQRP